MSVLCDSGSTGSAFSSVQEPRPVKPAPRPVSRPAEQDCRTGEASTIDWAPTRRRIRQDESDASSTWNRPSVGILGQRPGLGQPEWGVDPKGRLRFLPPRRFTLPPVKPKPDEELLPVVKSSIPSSVAGRYRRYLARQPKLRQLMVLAVPHGLCIMLLSAMALALAT